MKTILLLLTSLLLTSPAVVPARADEILFGTPHIYSGGGVVSPIAAEAEGFFVTQPVTLTSINVGVFTDKVNSTDLYLFQLVDRIGPGTTTSSVLASFPIPGSQIPGAACGPILPCVPQYLSLSLPLTLKPGEYFLVVAEVYPKQIGLTGALWGGAISTLPSTVGGIASTFFASGFDTVNPASSNWIPYTNNRILNFQLLGTVNKVPEPSSLLLLGTGALTLLAAELRKRRRQALSLGLAFKLYRLRHHPAPAVCKQSHKSRYFIGLLEC